MDHFAIQTRSLTRTFADVRAVDGITFDVPAGSIFGFLGPNGSGKTTTIRLLLGLLLPTSGNASVLGFDTQTQADEIRLNCGALLEHTGLYERMTAEDNLEFYGRVWRIPAAQRKERIQTLLQSLALWERRKDNVSQWSRGMKQKLSVARALLHQPKLIFLDEPTAGLDPVAAAALRDDLANLARRQGVTVFLTTHNLTEAEKLCDQVAVIRDGRLLSVGSPDTLRLARGGGKLEVVGRGFSEEALARLRQRPEVAAVEQHDQHLLISLAVGADSAPLVPFLAGLGVQIDEVRKGAANLEEVFLSLMKEEQE